MLSPPARERLRDRDWLAERVRDTTLRELGAELGCSFSTVHKAVKRLAIPMPSTADRRRLPWQDYVGQRFGMLTVRTIGAPAQPSGNTRVWTDCECGGEKLICLHILLKHGHGWDHCGCQSKARWQQAGEANELHGGRTRKPGKNKPQTAAYSSWNAMIDRCYRSTTNGYENYGGNGITVCTRWREGFVHFLADMGPRPAGHTLDRIDPDGNYEPDNCAWRTRSEQARNKRKALPFTDPQ